MAYEKRLIAKVSLKYFMMGESKELSQNHRKLIVENHTDCIGYRQIFKLLNVPVSTVGAIIRECKEHHYTINQPWLAAPCKISDRSPLNNLSCPRTKDYSQRSSERPGRKQLVMHSTTMPVCTLTMQDTTAHKNACGACLKHLDKPMTYWEDIRWDQNRTLWLS